MTAVYDYGLPISAQNDMITTAGNWIDVAKIVSASPRILPEDILQEKLEIYAQSGVRAHLGGQLYEYVLTTQGTDGVARLFDEAQRLGFGAIEISDTVIALDPTDRARHIALAHARGLAVFAEIGAPGAPQTPAALLAEVNRCFDDGADYVILEGTELLGADGPRKALVEVLKTETDLNRIFFEAPWLGYPGTSFPEVVALKKMLIREIGTGVNLANIKPDEVIELEGMRQAIENPDLWSTRVDHRDA